MNKRLLFIFGLMLLTTGCKPTVTADSSPWVSFDEAIEKDWSQMPLLIFGYPTFSASSSHGKKLIEESEFVQFANTRKIKLLLLEFDGWSDSRFQQFSCMTGPTKDPFCILYLGTSRFVFNPLIENSITIAVDLFENYQALER